MKDTLFWWYQTLIHISSFVYYCMAPRGQEQLVVQYYWWLTSSTINSNPEANRRLGVFKKGSDFHRILGRIGPRKTALWHVRGCKTAQAEKQSNKNLTSECRMVWLSERQLACEEMSPNPAEPAGLTFSCTAPGIVKGAALSLGARGWLTAHGGSGRAVTALRTSLSPRYLPDLQREQWVTVCVRHLIVQTKQTNSKNTKGLGFCGYSCNMYRWGICTFGKDIHESWN